MQYRISILVAIFSASTALAYLDCGGGRAPPKTTVPGCPGYIDPATVVSTSTSAVPTSTATYVADITSQYTTQHSTSTRGAQETLIYSEPGQYTVYEYPDSEATEGCTCSGYLCQFAVPGCLNLDTSSTITANSGWNTKSYDAAEYYSYIKTASAGGQLSMDGVRVELPTVAPSAPVSTSVYSTTSKTKTKTSTTATGATPSSTTITTLATSTISAQTNSTSSTTKISSSTGSISANATVSQAAQTSVVVADTNSASKISGMASLAALLVSGAAAIVLL